MKVIKICEIFQTEAVNSHYRALQADINVLSSGMKTLGFAFATNRFSSGLDAGQMNTIHTRLGASVAI